MVVEVSQTCRHSYPLPVKKKKLSYGKVNLHSDGILGQPTTRILPVVSFKLQPFSL